MTAARTTMAARKAKRRVQNEYEPLKAETLRSLSSKLRARGISLPDGDLEEYYNQAWHALYVQAASGAEIASTGGFIVQVAFRRAIDDLRRTRPGERADLPLEHVAAVEHDVVERLEDQRRLREFVEALREELGERERVAASLCYIHGYSRPEAAQLMGIGERRMQKVMDAVSKAIGRITREIQAGERCESRASVNKAYALGLLDPAGERYAAARAHLDECPRCRADVLGLRGLAIAAPPPLLPLAVAGAVGGGAGSVKRRRPPRSQVMAAAAAAAVVVAAALAAVGLSRGSSDPEPRDGSALSASTPAPSSPAPTASPAAPAAKPKRERETTPKRARRPEPRRRTAPTPVATVAPPAATPEPVPVSTPAPPAPTPTAAPPPAAAAPEPAVLDDGVQEFGVEP